MSRHLRSPRIQAALAAAAITAAAAFSACSGNDKSVTGIDAIPVAERGITVPWGIAFHSNRAGNYDIWVMNDTGTDNAGAAARNLTADNPGLDQWPAWSNDGRIAFASVRAAHTNSEIYIMNSDGSGARRLTTSSSANIQPAWSPNAREIAFVRGAGQTDNPLVRGTRQIWVIDAASGAERQLTHSGDNYHPSWSPDGKRIIFSSDRNGDFTTPAPENSASFGLHDVYTMDATTGDASLVRITNIPTSLDGEPSYSPDGQQIAFRTRRETSVESDGVTRHWCTIAVSNLDGSNVRYLTPKPATIPSAQWCNAFPAWSRNGKEIFFHSARSGIPLDIYMVGVDGTGLKRLTYDNAADAAPAVR